MRYTFILILITFFLKARAEDPRYPVSAIPQNLLKDANVVKRMEQQEWNIDPSGEIQVHKKFALTIMNEAGDDYAEMYVFYDKFIQVRSIEGNLYDAAGNRLKRVKDKDIKDESAVQDISLIDDNRIKRHNFYYKVYPYTVEYEMDLKIKNSLFLPSKWMPQNFEHLSVESSQITFITPADYVLHFKSFNYKGDPVVTNEKNNKKYTWQAASIPAIAREYECPTWNEITTAVYFAPADFEMQGYKGNLNSWQEFGKFVYDLKKDRDQLPGDVQQKVHELVQGASDEKEKVRKLYEFMQQHTRYISIQLGIGGLQPFEASFVAKKGYGDCKALSNYMYSLLKEAGIRSLYALVSAGSSKDDKYMLNDFPSDQFDHVILCVPMQKDSMWLECTSQDLPAGYMSDFTGNRTALLIDENGGYLVATPRYGINENTQSRTLKAQVDEEGTLSLHVNTDYRAEQEDYLHGMINALSSDKVKKYLNERLELGTYDVRNFKYQETKNILPVLNEQLDLSVSNYATITGKRLFITPNVLNRSTRKIDTDKRLYDFVFADSWKDIDSVEIEIPIGYEPEAIPADVSLKTKYGLYSCTTKISGNKIFYYRVREQYEGRFPAGEKESIAAFYNAVYKADRSRAVLVKKGG